MGSKYGKMNLIQVKPNGKMSLVELVTPMAVSNPTAYNALLNKQISKDAKVKTALNDKGHKMHGKAKSLVQRFLDKFKKKNGKKDDKPKKMSKTDQDFYKKMYNVGEGFGGELKGKDKEKFEKARKENAEQLGYKLTGKSDIREAVNIKDIEQIVKKKQAKKIDKYLVDMQTASAIMKVWKALNVSNKKKFGKLPIKKMAQVAWKLVK